MKTRGLKKARRHRSVERGVRILPALFLGVFAFSLPAPAKKAHLHSPKTSQVRPDVSIPLARLGYLPPDDRASFRFRATVSLHFIDSSHLLFAFHVPGLVHRDRKCPSSDSQRTVRALVLDLPSGKIESQADWVLYDFSDFLWGIDNGEFLLRRCSSLDLVGSNLKLRPWIESPGPIRSVTFSPDRSVAVVETPLKLPANSPKTYGQIDGPRGATHPIDAIFVHLHSLRVFAHARLEVPGTIPVIHNGTLETLIAPHNRWILNLHPFQGAQRKIATIHSFCRPDLTAVGMDVVVAAVCPKKHEEMFQAYSMGGATLWKIQIPKDRHYARFLLTQNGASFAIETLHATGPIAALDPLSKANVDAEIVEIYDTRTGIHIGSFATTPVYTAGKNADFSPDGQRMAILHNGAIEVYSLNQLAKNRLNLENKP